MSAKMKAMLASQKRIAAEKKLASAAAAQAAPTRPVTATTRPATTAKMTTKAPEARGRTTAQQPPQTGIKEPKPYALVQAEKAQREINVFLVARNRAVADKYGDSFRKHGARIFYSPVFTCAADAVIVIAENPGDLDELAEEFEDFTRAPCLAFFGPGAFDVGFTKHKSFNQNQAQQTVAYLKQEAQNVKEEISTTFSKYDADKDGILNTKELGNMSRGLGLLLDNHGIGMLSQIMDIGKSGSIGLMEFQAWWLAGQRSPVKYAAILEHTNQAQNKIPDTTTTPKQLEQFKSGGLIEFRTRIVSQEDQRASFIKAMSAKIQGKVADLKKMREMSKTQMQIRRRHTVPQDILVKIRNEAMMEKRKKKIVGEDPDAICEICYCPFNDGMPIPLSDCTHIFHQECLQDYIDTAIHDLKLEITCPMEGCNKVLPQHNLREVLPKKDFDKFLALQLDTTIGDLGNLQYCPNPKGCSFAFESVQACQFTCQVCNIRYCLLCNLEYHGTEWTCAQAKKKSPAFLKSMIAEEEFKKWKSDSGSKKCPKCKFDVIRNGGCDQMTCRCGEKFCWLCGGHINTEVSYYHEVCNACQSPKCTPCKDLAKCNRNRPRRPSPPAQTYCVGAESIVTVVDQQSSRQRQTTVDQLREGDEVVTAEGTAIIRIVVRQLRSKGLCKLPGDLLITNNHPVRINGAWEMPGALDIVEKHEVVEPIYIYNFVLDTCHVLLINGYECITLGHDLADEGIQHPYYGTELITKDLLALPGADIGYRTATGMDNGGHDDYMTQGICMDQAINA